MINFNSFVPEPHVKTILIKLRNNLRATQSPKCFIVYWAAILYLWWLQLFPDYVFDVHHPLVEPCHKELLQNCFYCWLWKDL